MIHTDMISEIWILKTEVSVILNLIRKTDSLVRIGGDEFLLVMPGISRNFDGKLREIRRRISSARSIEQP